MQRIDENHSFNTNVCKILKGHCQKAILLKEIYGWCHINKSKGNNIKFGIPWTFMSASGFAEKFHYMPKGSISRWLKELVKDGWIFSSNMNKKKYDRTLWYTINYKRYDDAVLLKEHTISQNDNWKSHFENLISQNEKPIPSNTPPTTTNTQEKEPISIDFMTKLDVTLHNYKMPFSDTLNESLVNYWKYMEERNGHNWGTKTTIVAQVDKVKAFLNNFSESQIIDSLEECQERGNVTYNPQWTINRRKKQNEENKSQNTYSFKTQISNA